MSKSTLKNIFYDLLEEHFTSNLDSNKSSLIANAITCTRSSLNIIKKMSSQKLEDLLNDCNKARSSQSELLHNIGFNMQIGGSSSMLKLKKSSNYIFVNQFEPFGQSLAFFGGHEFVTLDILQSLVKKGDTYVEVGASYGDFLLTISNKVSETGSVYGFEASTTVFPYLQASSSISKINNVQVQNSAISNETGTVIFQITDAVDGYNSLGSAIKSDSSFNDYSNLQGVKNVEVPSIKLDDYFMNNNIIPNLVRLDIEGSECRAVQGLENAIREHKPHLSIEFQSVLMARFESQESISNCLDIIYGNGYDIHNIFTLQPISQVELSAMYNELEDTELLCTYNSAELIEELQNSHIYDGFVNLDIQETGEV